MKSLLLGIAIALLMAASGTAAAQSSVDAGLRHEAMCSKWAQAFQRRPEWQGSNATFTSHFNKKLEKCLVEVTSSNVASGKIIEMHHVYDALENKNLGGEDILKELPSKYGQEKVISIMMVRDGKLLGKNDPQATRAAYLWFQTLMSD